MFDSLLAGSGSVTPFRRPLFTIEFGGGSDGGLGGALGGALDALIGADGDPWAEHLLALRVESLLAPSVDWASIDLADRSGAPRVALGDSGSISLGYQDGSAEPVLSATVEGLRHGLEGTQRITAVNGGATLSRLRVNQSYEQQSAGDIVSDLTAQAGVGTDTIEAGAAFPFLALDDRANAYEHIAALATRSGYVAFFTTAGDLYFGPWPAGQPVQTFDYGDDVLALELSEGVPAVVGVRVIGAGAAGSQGQDAWPWLLKDPQQVAASSGDQAQARLVVDAGLRSSEAAQSGADGLAYAAGLRAAIGSLLVPGAPAVTVASLIAVTGAPREALNGSFVVRRLRHLYSKRDGFVTRIEFSRADADGADGAGGLGGLL
jgi:phage protein D